MYIYIHEYTLIYLYICTYISYIEIYCDISFEIQAIPPEARIPNQFFFNTALSTRSVSVSAHRGWFFEELDGHPGLLHGGFTSAIVDDFTGLASWSLCSFDWGCEFCKNVEFLLDLSFVKVV